MRRSDRQLGDTEARDVLTRGAYGVLSTVGRDGEPYGVPLSYCVLEGAVYLHCAREGRKLDHLAREPRVSFCVVGATRVLPEEFGTLYESAGVEGAARMSGGGMRTTLGLAALATALMAAQAATGMAFPGLYRDVGFALDAWRVNDPVTAFVATPIALAALALAWRGSLRALLVLLGAMQYALYNYAFYLFGAALNAHFLLYVAAFVVSGAALIAGLVALDAAAIGRAMSPRLPARPLAGYLAFWAGALGVAWVAQALAFAVTGEEPALGADVFRLIAALDLALVVAPAAVAAAWLWRRRAWGVILAVVLHVKGAVYALLLAIGSALGGPLVQGGDGLLALWLVFVVGSGASLVVLLASLRPAET